MASVPEIVVLQVSKAMVSISSTVMLVPGIIAGVPSVPLPTGPLSLLENFRQSDKRKTVVDGEGEMATTRRGMLDYGDSRRARGAERLLLGGLKTNFSTIEERPEPLLLLLTGPSISILGLVKTNWTQPF
ncbi:hypothetical protein Fot_23591 [Forsythia ovata]|uniref:Uncharacterized protein n=1 Tax=Forsythia ovata TaxID=205694 RepID=A0ABD1V2V5_9LAMI